MTKNEERQKKIKQIEDKVSELKNEKLELNFSEVIEAIVEAYNEMINNPNNDSHENKQAWEETVENLEMLVDKMDRLSIEYETSHFGFPAYPLKPKKNYSVAATREREMSKIAIQFKTIEELYEGIRKNASELEDELQNIIDNTADNQLLEDARENAEECLSALQDILNELELEEYEELFDIVDKLK